jgi:ribosome-associated translation inhibitor RaiA
MHISVLSNIAVTDQTRAYAEYRVFAGLAALSRLVQEVEVRLDSRTHEGVEVDCVVCVEITSGKRARVRARGRHAYDAINRAADRMSHRLWELAGAEGSIRDAR